MYGLTDMLPILGLVVIVALILTVSRTPLGSKLTRWLPVPFWCYVLPMLATTFGILPAEHEAYSMITRYVLPIALVLLILGADLSALPRLGGRALLVGLAGSIGIAAGATVAAFLLKSHLPVDAWKGVGALAGTWTGGSMNLLSVRTVIGIRDELFAPLIIVDAFIAYGWMALLVAGTNFQTRIDHWLKANTLPISSVTASSTKEFSSIQYKGVILSGFIAIGLTLVIRFIARWLPTNAFITSANGWAIILITTITLGLSFIPLLKRFGQQGFSLGYPCLYLVLAAIGSQGSFASLKAAPIWILLGLITVIIHGAILLLAGKLLRVPLGLLATVSQANIGGLVSGPLVGAIYHRNLVPIGLLLAVFGNAFGTYLGLFTAWMTRILLGS